MTFGEVLRSLRKQHHLTQSELAKALQVAESAVSMWERGRRRPDMEMMERIADYFKVDMNYLFGKSDFVSKRFTIDLSTGEKILDVTIPRKAPEPISRKDLQFALWGGEQGMDDEDLQAVLDYAEYIKARKAKNKPETQ